jgi:hypothetical protein
MAKMRVTLASGRTVEGEITNEHGSGEPVLLADGRQFSALDAVNNGISIDPVNDPMVDIWLSTF